MHRKYLGGTLAAAMVMFGGSAQAINIEFDYSLDTGNYFTPGMRQVLGEVGSVFGRNITNSFGALTNFSGQLGDLNIQNLSLPADTLRIYVQPTDLSNSSLALAYVGTAQQTFTRGFGGYIQFDTVGSQYYDPVGGVTDWSNIPSQPAPRNWYVDDDITTVEPFPVTKITLHDTSGNAGWIYDFPFDFYSVAMHEMEHVFGLPHASGTSTAYGESQTVAMYGSITGNTRRYFTEADWLAMNRAGWQVASLSPDLVSAVPEPSSYAMLLAGLGLVGAAARRRRATRQP